MPYTPDHIIDEAIQYAEKMRDTPAKELSPVSAWEAYQKITLALIDIYEGSLPDRVQRYHEEYPAWVGIEPGTIVTDAERSNIKQQETIHKYPLLVPHSSNELIKHLEELKALFPKQPQNRHLA